MNAPTRIPEADLILNEDGSIYHLHLQPDQIAETIITVGDPGRVEGVSKYFTSVEHKVHHREFVTHTGYYNGKRLTVISTGIGTDNIDIVLNELDALVNIDLRTRLVKNKLTSLNIIRLGTSGAVNEEIEVDSIVQSEISVGMDGLMNFYKTENSVWERDCLDAFVAHLGPAFKHVHPYIIYSSENLLKKFGSTYHKGLTLTANGFYAPQGRQVRAQTAAQNYLQLIHQFRYKDVRFSNLEMETAGIYGLGKLLGHNCLSVSAILVNRIAQTVSADPKKIIDKMIGEVLDIITG